MNRARVIKTSGETNDLDHRPTLKEAQETVGGYIELLKATEDKTDKRVTLVVNEEGRLKSLSINVFVTAGYSVGSRFNTSHFPIVGDVIVLYGWQTVAA
jgi:hypothetical protein